MRIERRLRTGGLPASLGSRLPSQALGGLRCQTETRPDRELNDVHAENVQPSLNWPCQSDCMDCVKKCIDIPVFRNRGRRSGYESSDASASARSMSANGAQATVSFRHEGRRVTQHLTAAGDPPDERSPGPVARSHKSTTDFPRCRERSAIMITRSEPRKTFGSREARV
jgi:hypothetical protein